MRQALFRSRRARRCCGSLLAISLWHGASHAAMEADFDATLLFQPANAPAIDVSRYRYGNPTPAGQYLADVTLNGRPLGRHDLRFANGEPGHTNGNSDTAAALCLSPALLAQLDLRPEALSAPADPPPECERLADRIPAMRAHFDLATLHLQLDIAQALLMTRPRGYIPPSQWQDGVPAAFVHYDANHYRNHAAGRSRQQQSYLGLRGGAVLGGWTLRHRGSLQWPALGARRYQRIDTYVQREWPALQSQLTLGDFHSGGRLHDGIGLRGLRLADDARMLPAALQGYAPQVRGVADSTAHLTIHQDGYLIYDTTVPAGPFVIDDLYPSSVGSDLIVTLTEADGRVRRFTVPSASFAELVRPGYARYQLAAGRYRESDGQLGAGALQASLQYGLRNTLTLNAALEAASRYHSALLGAAWHTSVGAFGADVTLARRQLPATPLQRGYRLHLRYSTQVPQTGTYFTLAAYRYASPHFYTLRDTLNQLHDPDANGMLRPRHRLQFSINQRLPKDWGAFYFSGSTATDWQSPGRSADWQLSYNQQYRSLSYQLSYAHTRALGPGHTEHRLHLTLSLPLGRTLRAPLWSSSISRSPGRGHALQTNVSASAGARNEFGYSLSAGTAADQGAAYGLNGYWHAPYARLSANASTGRHHRQYAAGASGAVVLHPHGLTLGNELSDTFAIVHAPGAAGVPLPQTRNHRLDRQGLGLVPYLSPYQRNRIPLDPTGLPLDVALSATEQIVTPRANRALLVRFDTEIGVSRLFRVKLPDGTVPPMATEAVDHAGHFVGYVAQAGLLFTRGLPAHGQLLLSWGENGRSRCQLDYDVSHAPNHAAGPPQTIPASCVPLPPDPD